MRIRKLKRNEITKASGIVERNHSKFYASLSRSEMKVMFGSHPIPKYMSPTYMVAEDEGKIVGLAGYCQSWIDYHAYDIFWVNVLKSYRNRGIGTALVKRSIEEIKRKKGHNSAHVTMLNAKNPKLYAKLGVKDHLINEVAC